MPKRVLGEINYRNVKNDDIEKCRYKFCGEQKTSRKSFHTKSRVASSCDSGS